MGHFRAVKLHVANRTLYKISKMVLLKSVSFLVFEILRSLVSMQTSLNANNCWHEQNFENCLTWLNFIFVELSEYGINFVPKSIFSATENVVSHKMTILENEAALLCVTMWKCARGMAPTMWQIKFLFRCHSVENRFFWCQLQVWLSRKQA